MHHGGLHEDDIAGKAYDRRLMRRFTVYLRPHLRTIIYVLLLLPPLAGAKLVQPYIVKIAIDSHIVTGNLTGLPTLALLFLALILGAGGLWIAERTLFHRPPSDAKAPLVYGEFQGGDLDASIAAAAILVLAAFAVLAAVRFVRWGRALDLRNVA